MHLGNGAITPECVVLTYGAAAAGLATGAAAARRAGLTREKLQLAAGLGCLVFAAQAVNAPILPGTSAHLVGGVLLAWMVGPGLGAWTMALVLAVQALVLGDGGITALGANVLNMAILPAALVAATNRMARRSLPVMGLMAGLAVPLAAGMIVVETGLLRPATELTGWTGFAATMLTIHAWVGVLEGGLTVALAIALAPLISEARPWRGWRLAFVGLTAAGLLAISISLSSTLPDAYDAAAQVNGVGWLLAP